MQNIKFLANGYCGYIKRLSALNSKNKILTIRLNTVRDYISKLSISEIFDTHDELDLVSTLIYTLFDSKEFCKKQRIFKTYISMLFRDLNKIHSIYSIIMKDLLSRFNELSETQMNKIYHFYKSFCDTYDMWQNEIPIQFGFDCPKQNFFEFTDEVKRKIED